MTQQLDQIQGGFYRHLNVTPWREFTPGTPSVITASAVEGQRRFDGPDMLITATYTITSVAAGDIEWTAAMLMPSGRNFDTDVIIAEAALFGSVKALNSSAGETVNDRGGIPFFDSSGTIKVQSLAGDTFDSDSPFTWEAGDSLTITVRIPYT